MTGGQSYFHVTGERVKSPRSASRTAVLKILRSAAHVLRLEIADWNCGATTSDRNGGIYRLRYRTLAEYPENNPKTLRDSAAVLRKIAGLLLRTASHLEADATAVERERR